ncbi:hypothetical protein BDR26DRAFT_693745 [Obelidium mucronatum]|nr:hypothetical protein BDR26DRAFT_693745 [Obelidium mucronatum]
MSSIGATAPAAESDSFPSDSLLTAESTTAEPPVRVSFTGTRGREASDSTLPELDAFAGLSIAPSSSNLKLSADALRRRNTLAAGSKLPVPNSPTLKQKTISKSSFGSVLESAPSSNAASPKLSLDSERKEKDAKGKPASAPPKQSSIASTSINRDRAKSLSSTKASQTAVKKESSGSLKKSTSSGSASLYTREKKPAGPPTLSSATSKKSAAPPSSSASSSSSSSSKQLDTARSTVPSTGPKLASTATIPSSSTKPEPSVKLPDAKLKRRMIKRGQVFRIEKSPRKRQKLLSSTPQKACLLLLNLNYLLIPT